MTASIALFLPGCMLEGEVKAGRQGKKEGGSLIAEEGEGKVIDL